ncbi:MAG: methyltransferase domain-containing protein [Polyangiaceae bacterium]|nr:methyltransferase domain-containing protein [Polyangiaceae bacterium]
MKRDSFMEFDGLALDLFFCSEILKLSSLHYGLWADPGAEPLTLDNLRAAQRRYTEALFRLIPGDTRSALDVGCGLGDVARGLVARGIRVTAISPDKNHGRYVEGAGENVRFVQSRYQNFSSKERFDLVLMSESQNYFQPGVCFEQTSRFLRPGGHLLVAGMFRKSDGKPFPDHVNVLEEFIGQGASMGFEVVENQDITGNVLPTLTLVHGAMRSYIDPSVDLLQRYAQTSAPVKARVLGLVFRRQLEELRGIYRYLLAKTDPDAFAEHGTYRMLLMRRGLSATRAA